MTLCMGYIIFQCLLGLFHVFFHGGKDPSGPIFNNPANGAQIQFDPNEF